MMKFTDLKNQSEGLRVARLLMVFSSISPLFILWAIRGGNRELIPDTWFIFGCILLAVVPSLVLVLRIVLCIHNDDKKQLEAGTVEDQRDHLLVYLFAMLLPFYSETLGNWRDFAATAMALVFIIFLFWHLNMHYMNLWFAIFRYRVFTVFPPKDNNPLTCRLPQILITKRVSILPGDKIIAYRISNSVHLELS